MLPLDRERSSDDDARRRRLLEMEEADEELVEYVDQRVPVMTDDEEEEDDDFDEEMDDSEEEEMDLRRILVNGRGFAGDDDVLVSMMNNGVESSDEDEEMVTSEEDITTEDEAKDDDHEPLDQPNSRFALFKNAVLIKILAYLGPRDLLRLSGVSQRWRRMCFRYAYRLFMTSNLQLRLESLNRDTPSKALVIWSNPSFGDFVLVQSAEGIQSRDTMHLLDELAALLGSSLLSQAKKARAITKIHVERSRCTRLTWRLLSKEILSRLSNVDTFSLHWVLSDNFERGPLRVLRRTHARRLVVDYGVLVEFGCLVTLLPPETPLLDIDLDYVRCVKMMPFDLARVTAKQLCLRKVVLDRFYVGKLLQLWCNGTLNNLTKFVVDGVTSAEDVRFVAQCLQPYMHAQGHQPDGTAQVVFLNPTTQRLATLTINQVDPIPPEAFLAHLPLNKQPTATFNFSFEE